MVWNSPFGTPTADGILDFNSRDWIFQAAHKLRLPMGVNIGLEANNPCLANRYPNDMTPNAEQYVGGWYGAINFGCGTTVAWSSDAVQDVALGQLQPLVRQLNGEDTVVNWLEPHEEMCHGVCDVLDDHGPNARLNFYRFLKTRYKTPEARGRSLATAGGLQDMGGRSFSRIRHLPGLERHGDRSDGHLENQLRRALRRPLRQDRSGRLGVGRRPRAGPCHRACPAAQAGRLPPARQDRSGLAGGASAGLALSAGSERHPWRDAGRASSACSSTARRFPKIRPSAPNRTGPCWR